MVGCSIFLKIIAHMRVIHLKVYNNSLFQLSYLENLLFQQSYLVNQLQCAIDTGGNPVTCTREFN